MAHVTVHRIERWNVTLGIPDTAFVVTDSVLMEFVGKCCLV